MYIDDPMLFRKAALAGALEHMCQSLELTATQLDEAKTHYDAVAEWLAAAADPALRSLSIYLQGSTALGTTVKPLGGNEHDVDLVAHMARVEHRGPAEIKRVIGDRLKEHARYGAMLVEKQRCWRLPYANRFHLDITPSVLNPACRQGGELVPDKRLRCWKESNPKGYKALFGRRAAIVPTMRLAKSAFDSTTARADVEPYPDTPRFKGLLRRIVQIAKRHRDVHFAERYPERAPISVLITTLASQSYERCATQMVFDSELDLLLTVIRHMPDFVERRIEGGHVRWFVWNETTHGENFAERWDDDPQLANAFFLWHGKLVSDLETLERVEGLDRLGKSLQDSFGGAPATRAIDAITEEVSAARTRNRLYVAPRVGLVAAAGASAIVGAAPVRGNTFFGAEPA